MSPALFAGGLILGQATATPKSPGGFAVQSILDFLVKGGPVMIPIGICSLIAVAVVVERMMTLRRERVIPAGFLPAIQTALRDNGGGSSAALACCDKSDSPVARVFATGIKRLGEPVDMLERHVQEAGEREVIKLNRFLRALSLIASVSTLLGLLGTILGLIEAFQTVALSGEALGKTELLAKGIYEAMITTAAGLCVSIPTVIAYHAIQAKIERLASEMDRMVLEFLEEHAFGRGAGDSSVAASATRRPAVSFADEALVAVAGGV